MTLPTSGQLTISQIYTEINGSHTTQECDFRILNTNASFTVPDQFNDFYGYNHIVDSRVFYLLGWHTSSASTRTTVNYVTPNDNPVTVYRIGSLVTAINQPIITITNKAGIDGGQPIGDDWQSPIYVLYDENNSGNYTTYGPYTVSETPLTYSFSQYYSIYTSYNSSGGQATWELRANNPNQSVGITKVIISPDTAYHSRAIEMIINRVS